MLKTLKSLPISFKLITTTTVLLTFTVGLYGLMNVQDLSKVYDESLEDQQAIILQAVTADAKSITNALADTAVIFMAGESFGDLRTLVSEMREQDPRLVYVQVTDLRGQTPVVEVDQGEREPTLEGLTPVPERGSAHEKRVKFGFGADLGSSVEVAFRESIEFLTRGDEPRLIRAVVGFEAAEDADVGALKGRVEAGWSIATIAERNAVIASKVEKQRAKSVKNAIFVGAMIVLLGALLTVFQSLRISRPIRELTESVERIAHGDLGERAIVSSADEIGVLGRNFNYMAERLGVLLTETKEKATLEKELEVARIIQDSLLPPSWLIDRGYFQFMGYFKSASICGGDWWSFADLANEKLLVLIGDVTGHGVSSAMITAAAKSCCDTLRNVTEGELTVTFLLEELNKTIYEAANRKFVMTFFATIIDPRAGTLTFSNAGHNFPVLFRANAGPDEPKIVPLVTRGNRLGDVMESRFLERTVPFSQGDVVVWYTDGLTEGVGKNGEEYGEKRFRRSIRAALEKGADEILEKVIRDAEAFFADFTHPEDDITLVVGKFTDQHVAARPKPPALPDASPRRSSSV